MCDAIRGFLNTKILLLLLVVSLSGNALLAYKLTQILEQLNQHQSVQKDIQEKTDAFRKNMSKPLMPSKAVTSW